MDHNRLFYDLDYFNVNVSEYDSTKHFCVTRPASLRNPKNHAVMFIQKRYMKMVGCFDEVESCLVFWPKDVEVPQNVSSRHAVSLAPDPHLAFCRFFRDHSITNFLQKTDVREVDHYLISGNVHIGKDPTIFPYVFISGNVTIGDNVYIGAGAKIIGNVYIGNNVLIKENAVLGADGLTTDREPDGRAVSMPQFGGLIIEDDVQIGANTTIARGAIDNTVIGRGCKIDNSCFVSHNNILGENVFMVGESTTFGSVTIGRNTQISGNAAIRNGLTVGEGSLVGAGAMVTRNVKGNTVVSGNPAREMLFPK